MWRSWHLLFIGRRKVAWISHNKLWSDNRKKKRLDIVKLRLRNSGHFTGTKISTSAGCIEMINGDQKAMNEILWIML